MSDAFPVTCGPVAPVLLTLALWVGQRYPLAIIIGPNSSRTICNFFINVASMSARPQPHLQANSSGVKFGVAAGFHSLTCPRPCFVLAFSNRPSPKVREELASFETYQATATPPDCPSALRQITPLAETGRPNQTTKRRPIPCRGAIQLETSCPLLPHD